MKRRMFVTYGAGLASASLGALSFREALALSVDNPYTGRPFPILDEVLDTLADGTWWDAADAVRSYSSLAYSFADLRVAYEQPANISDFSSRIFGEIQTAFFGEGDGGLPAPNRSDVVGFLSDAAQGPGNVPLINALRPAMHTELRKNITAFELWLTSLGIDDDSVLRGDFLRAQAIFAIFQSLVRFRRNQSDYHDLTVLRNFTWIWPFC